MDEIPLRFKLDTRADVRRQFKSSLGRESKKCQDTVYIVQRLNQPLVEQPAIQALHLIEFIRSWNPTTSLYTIFKVIHRPRQNEA